MATNSCFMKQLNVYEEPILEVLEVIAELGFVGSMEATGKEDEKEW